ncbi:hypothetical protein AMTR_s00056p00216040 [Amborella trichopoda]|uniref:TIR domain-containing protein n=1 Tax=Amborella trichopoda TaxID=13333 RepID=U5CYK9_AMBTC|nr:hypothetical protein AMTR_s00056p00216040 [Amborella trichopoda]
MAVFLNLCDEDTGKSFTAHLNKALIDSAISTFFFSPTQQLPTTIQRAIERCELSYLLSLPRVTLVLPVYYDVEPSHVRWQKGPFDGAFVDHKSKNGIDEATIQKWKNALKEVADLSGWEMKNYRTEANLVEELVKHVSAKLECKTPFHVASHPVGLDSGIVDMMELLDIDTNDARIVGIHGMGGIGKTTLAKAVFNKIRSSFQGTCFLSDVRESSKTNGGVVTLQKQLLKELFNEGDPSIYNVDGGICVIKNKIGSKKVLVVIDDVDSEKQLEKLAINRDWYYQGSRIIITKRDEHVLNVNNRVDKCHIYKLKELDGIESLQLFSYCAFGRNEPVQEYAKLSYDVVSTASGLPLALEVLGSYFWDKTPEEW